MFSYFTEDHITIYNHYILLNLVTAHEKRFEKKISTTFYVVYFQLFNGIWINLGQTVSFCNFFW